MTTIAPIHLDDDALLLEAFALETRATLAQRSGWTPLTAEVRLHRWRGQQDWTHQLSGAWQQGRLVGLGELAFWHKEPTSQWVDAEADPEAGLTPAEQWAVRRELLDAVMAAAPAGTRRFLSEPFARDEQALAELVRELYAPAGFRHGSTEVVREADLSRREWQPAPAPEGWHVVSAVNGLPEELREQVGRFKGLVDVDAPSGVDWPEHVTTPEEYQQVINEALALGQHLVEAVAVDENGRLGAWTMLETAPSPGRPAQVAGTYVLRECRGQGLGMVVKVAVAEAAAATGVTRLRTMSDADNRWMHAINERLGFRPVEVMGVLEKVV